MGGARETVLPKAADPTSAGLAIGDLRLHEANGQVHFHDDKAGLKYSEPFNVKVADWRVGHTEATLELI